MSLRKLNLHASALNDSEYSLYTSSLADITLADEHDLQGHDDSYYEQMTLTLREARAWFKGRYSHLPAAVIDDVLRFFSPNLSQADNLTGGQFFAAQRLLVHAESGKEVDRSLAFVQAYPTNKPIARPSSPPKPQISTTPSRRSIDVIRPTSQSTEDAGNSQFTPPPQHPSASNNPFTLGRAKSNPGVPPSSKSHDGSSFSTPHRLPPLPPRKSASPAVLPPPRHGSLGSTAPSLITPSMLTSKSVPIASAPAVPPKPSHFTHVTSTLMKQSLQASKTGQTMKKAEEQLERERVLQVLKSSASKSTSPFASSSGSRNRSTSPNKLSATPSSNSGSELERESTSQAPPLPLRRKVSPPGSVSTSSFQQVALASTSPHPSPSNNPFVRNAFSDTRSQTSVVSSAPRRSPTSPIDPTSAPPNTASLPPPKHPDQSHRKPPPPPPVTSSPFNKAGIADSLDLTSSGRSPSNFPRVPYTTHGTSFPPEVAGPFTGSAAVKSASPYVSAFTPETTPGSSPARNGDESPTTRLFRSKSMHQPGSPTSPFSPTEDLPGHSPLPPPVRRKRPESFQVLPGSSPFSAGSSFRNPNAPHSSDGPHNSELHRRDSSNYDVSRPHDPLHLKSLAASIQPQFQQLQPKLDKARFKAEAGLSRRGFIVNPKASRRKEDQEGLMSGEDRDIEDGDSKNPYRQGRRSKDRMRTVSDSGVSGWEDNVVYSDSSDDDDIIHNRGWGKDQGTIRSRRVGSAPDQDHLGADKDHLKWPVGEGEGWNRL